jgi:hypothetical protein
MNRQHLLSRIRALSLAVAALSSMVGKVSADTIVLPVFSDTTLNQAAPGNNMGAHPQILSGTDGSGQLRRGLLSFDTASEFPAGAIVHSATLYLTATAANPAAGDFRLHRVLADWGEGTGNGATGAAALTGDATWNSRHHGTSLWSVPGGLAGADYLATSSSTTNVSAAGEYAFAGLADDVQWMVDNPANNFGWMLISGREGTAQTARQFIAGEGGGATIPRLEVEYSLVPEPGALFLAIVGIALASGGRLRYRVRSRLRTCS